MPTLVESLVPLFGNPDADSSHEGLLAHIRDYVNNDFSGTVDLSDEIEDARAKFNDLYNGGDYLPTSAPEMRMLGNIKRALNDVLTEQRNARAELDDEFSRTAAEFATDGDAPAPDADPEPASDPEPAPTAEEPNNNEGDTGDSPAPAPEPADAVAADGGSGSPAYRVRPTSTPVRLPSAGAINANRPPNSIGDTSRVKYSVLAAAEVPRTTAGSTLTMRELAEATNRRFGVMPLSQMGVSQKRGSIALIKRTFDNNLTTYNDRRDSRIIDRVANEKNLPGGSLIAAAREHRSALTAAGCCTSMTNDVWCSPSETDYSLCPPLATTEGLIDLPTIPINNGGIRYPVWEENPADWHGQVVMNDCDDPIPPDFFTQDGNEKTCIEGPCPEWQEKRLNLAYLCVRGDILRDSTWPELTQRFIEDTLVHHQHFMNHQYLSGLYNGSDQLPAFDVSADGIGSVSDSVVDRLGLLVAWFRERYKLGQNETLEGVAPSWFKEYVRIDLARKNNRAYSTVTDAEIEELFAAYATRIQWVYDTEGIVEDASLGNGEPVDGRPMPGAWPNNVEMLFFPAGSWVLGQQDVITLDAFYDSMNLRQNKYTALFTEEGFLLLNRCNRSFRVRLTGLCRNGGVAAPVEITCPEPTPEPGPEPTPPDGDGGGDTEGAAARVAQSAAASTAGTGTASRRRRSADS